MRYLQTTMRYQCFPPTWEFFRTLQLHPDNPFVPLATIPDNTCDPPTVFDHRPTCDFVRLSWTLPSLQHDVYEHKLTTAARVRWDTLLGCWHYDRHTCFFVGVTAKFPAQIESKTFKLLLFATQWNKTSEVQNKTKPSSHSSCKSRNLESLTIHPKTQHFVTGSKAVSDLEKKSELQRITYHKLKAGFSCTCSNAFELNVLNWCCIDTHPVYKVHSHF